jgi:hypothetical protein
LREIEKMQIFILELLTLTRYNILFLNSFRSYREKSGPLDIFFRDASLLFQQWDEFDARLVIRKIPKRLFETINNPGFLP